MRRCVALAWALVALACGDPAPESVEITPVADADMGTGGDAGDSFGGATAPAVMSGSGTLDLGDKNDYFLVDLDEGDRIRVTVTQPAGADFDLRLIDPAGTIVASSTTGAPTERAEATARTAGPWRVRVSRARGHGRYELSILIEPAMGPPDAGPSGSDATDGALGDGAAAPDGALDSGPGASDGGLDADADGALDAGADAGTGVDRPALDTGTRDGGAWTCVNANATGAADFRAAPFSSQTRVFSIEHDVTPSATNIDTAVGLSPGPASSWFELATIVRFNAGVIDARDGDTYRAQTAVSFAAGATYRVRTVVDLTRQRYSVFVTPPAQAERVIATDYAFRRDIGSIGQIDHWTAVAESGSLAVCGLAPVRLDSCGDGECTGAETCGTCRSDCRSCGATYYVATSGSDGAAGTSGAPWQTIQHAIDTAPAGSTIVVRSGTYPAQVVFSDKEDLIVRGEGATRPVISSSAQNAVWFYANAHGSRLQNVEVSGGQSFGIKIDGQSRIVIEDCTIHDAGNDLIKLTPGADDVIIRRNELYRSGGGSGTTGQGVNAANTDRLLVQDNDIHDIRTEGIALKAGSIGAVIERNRITRAGAHVGSGIAAGFIVSDWQLFDPAANPEMHECIDCVVRNNIVLGATAAGVGIYGSKRSMVLSNTFVDVASSVQAGLWIVGVENFPNGGARIFIPNVDPTVRNNVFQIQSTARPGAMVVGTAAEPGVSGAMTLDDNRYHASNGALRFVDETASFTGDLSAWRTQISGESRSTEGPPGVDATGHLVAGSACVDRGSALGTFAEDFDREVRPRGAGWDIGADEAR